MSILYDDIECAEALLSAPSIKVDMMNSSGLTALQYAASKSKSEFVDLLIQHNANVNAKTRKGRTILDILDSKSDEECIESVLSCSQIDVTQKHKGGLTALHYACKWKLKECVDHLLELNADINAKTNMGKTALLIAAKNNDSDCMARLLNNRSIDVTATDANKFTALHFAAQHGLVEHLESMLLYGGNDILYARTKEGKTPLDIAISHKQVIFIEEIQAVMKQLEHRSSVDI